jgi:hypothetical protein
MVVAGGAALALLESPAIFIAAAVSTPVLACLAQRMEDTKQLYSLLRRSEFGVFASTSPARPPADGDPGGDDLQRERRRRWRADLAAWQDRYYREGVPGGSTRPEDVWELLAKLPWHISEAQVRREAIPADGLIVDLIPQRGEAPLARARVRSHGRDWFPGPILIEAETRGDRLDLTLRREGTSRGRTVLRALTHFQRNDSLSGEPPVWLLTTGRETVGEAIGGRYGLLPFEFGTAHPVVLVWLRRDQDFHWSLPAIPTPDGATLTIVFARSDLDDLALRPEPAVPPRSYFHDLMEPPAPECHRPTPPPEKLAWLDVLAPAAGSTAVLAVRSAEGKYALSFATDRIWSDHQDVVRFRSL